MLGRKRREDDLRRELQNHLDLEAEEQGEPNAARRTLGNPALIQEATRETWGMMWLDRLASDVRYGCRAVRKEPGFAAVVVLTAALGIGANTSIFSIVDAVLLHPLPYPDAGRLVSPVVTGDYGFLGLHVADFQYAAWRDQATVFDGIAAYSSGQFTVAAGGETEQLKVGKVTPAFLHVLGVRPIIGRDLSDADAPSRGGHIALISHALWMKRFNGDPAVLSRSMTLDGKLYSIAGVLPPSFEFPESSERDLLLAMPEPGPPANSGTIWFYNVVARLKRGITTERAERDIDVIDKRLAAAYPVQMGHARARAHTVMSSLHDRLVGDVRPALLALSGAVAMVLLIVCVNISNLLLARATARQREIAVRIALGAGQARILRQLLTEGMLLAGAGALGGLALAFGGVRLLRAIAPSGVPHIQSAHLSGAVLMFTAGLAVLCGILFGLAPLRGVSGIDLEAVLKRSARTASGDRRYRRLEGLLVVAETAFALILLAGAGLLIRTFAGLTSIPTGFRADGVLTASVTLPYWKYSTPERQRDFVGRLLEAARSAPGLNSASSVAVEPYGGFVMTSCLEVEGRPKPATCETDSVAVNFAGGDYFKVMGIPLLEGRVIGDGDTPGRQPVAVVNQTLARHFFPDGRAVGSRIRSGGSTGWVEIAGVVGDVKQGGLASKTRPEIVQPAMQQEDGGGATTLVIRSTADRRVLVPWLRARIAQLDRDLPPAEIETMREIMAAHISSQIFVMRLLGLFAAIAVVLAAIGIYSVLAYSVERRSHEIGIRLALGAGRRHIATLVLGRGLRLSLAGAALGVAGGLALTRYLKSLLYGVTPQDPATLAAGCALIVLIALAASCLPARRAVRQDTIATLRAE